MRIWTLWRSYKTSFWCSFLCGWYFVFNFWCWNRLIIPVSAGVKVFKLVWFFYNGAFSYYFNHWIFLRMTSWSINLATQAIKTLTFKHDDTLFLTNNNFAFVFFFKKLSAHSDIFYRGFSTKFAWNLFNHCCFYRPDSCVNCSFYT